MALFNLSRIGAPETKYRIERRGVMSETAPEHWAVTVERNGESVLTIETNCLSGRDLSADDERVIRMAAQHLLSFVGTAAATKEACGCDTYFGILCDAHTSLADKEQK